MGELFYPPSQKNVNKPPFKYNDLQPGTKKESETSNCINVAVWLSERSTSLNLSHQVFDERYTQACMCKLAELNARQISLVSASFSYMLEAHVDAIRKFCSALKSVHRESKGGRDARENMSGEVSETVEKRRDLRRKHQAEVSLILFQLTADYQ